MVEVRYRQGGQKSRSFVVVFGLQRLPGQDLLNEELLERLGDGNGEPADEQCARSRRLQGRLGRPWTPHF